MQVRPRVCIPVFDNPATIAKLVGECLEKLPWPLLVVDDGSEIPVERLLTPHERLTVLRLPENRGKGAAIQAAFADSVALGFTHIVTVDGDGQHLVAEVKRLVETSIQNPWHLVVGARFLDDAPPVSRFGKRFSNFWVKFQTETRVADSQSGLRVYPLFHVQNLRFFTRRYDFEIEVLIRLLWKSVHVIDVPVRVHYPPPRERVSHFRKFRDNVRISLLNSVLVAVSLVGKRLTPRQASIALGLGIFVGCTPLYGLHTLIVAALAFALRLNVGLLFVGSQISLPPIAPLVAMLSIHTGRWFLGEGGTVAPWFVGGALVGLTLGGTAAAVTYLVASVLEKRPKSWSGRTRGGKFGNRFLDGVLRVFGRHAGYACLYFIVPYFYFFAPRATRASLEYWRVVEPTGGFFRRRWQVLKHYYRFGTVLMDRRLQGMTDRALFQSMATGFENITAHASTGLILVSGHIGSWDIASRYLDSDFHPVRFESEPVPEAAPETTRVRPVPANRTSSPIFDVHCLLGEGRAVGMMADRPVGKHYELVLFFGKLAAFDSTPFQVAALTGKPLLFSFGAKGRGKTYEFYATPAKLYRYEPGRPREDQRVEWVREYARELERFVGAHREQWFNFFPLWSASQTA